MFYFYSGYGQWVDTCGNKIVPYAGEYCSGVFRLNDDARKQLKYKGKAKVWGLLASDHPDAPESQVSLFDHDHGYFRVTDEYGISQYIEIMLSDVIGCDDQKLQQLKQQESPAITQPDDLTESRERTLLKQIGGLALVLAEKNQRYKKGDGVSATAIADAVGLIIDALPEKNRHGLASSSLRTSIKNGLELIKN